MKDLVCVNCSKEFKGKPPSRLSTDKSPESNMGVCPKCLKAAFDFSRKSFIEDRDRKIIRIRNSLKEKFKGYSIDDSVNIPGEEITVKFKDDSIIVQSKIKLDYFGSIKEKNTGSSEIVDFISKLLSK